MIHLSHLPRLQEEIEQNDTTAPLASVVGCINIIPKETIRTAIFLPKAALHTCRDKSEITA